MEITAKVIFPVRGGMDLGMLQAGINVVESFEIDKNVVQL